MAGKHILMRLVPNCCIQQSFSCWWFWWHCTNWPTQAVNPLRVHQLSLYSAWTKSQWL